MKPIQRILFATDFSDCSAAAAAFAAQLARQLKVGVDVVTVVDTSPLNEAYGDAAFRTQRINEIRAGAHATAVDFTKQHLAGTADVQVHVRDGHPFLEIIAAAQEFGCDLIVLGTHGRTGIAHLVMGSVAEKVLRKSPIPVMTVRGNA